MRLVITSAKNLYAICINHEGLIVHIYYLSYYTTTYVGSRSRLNKKQEYADTKFHACITMPAWQKCAKP